MLEVFIVVGLLALIAILAIVIILLLNNLGAYFTEVAKGTTAFIVAGKNLQEILPNIDGYKKSSDVDLEGQHWLIPAKDEDEQIATLFHDAMFGTAWFQKWLWKRSGVKFISLFWPQNRVHKFDIRKGGRRRIVARNELVADAPLRSRVVDSEEKTTVDSLLFLAPRPVYMEGVELAGDNSKINLLLLPIFRQVIPSLPVFNLKGDFFTLLDAAVEAAVVDFFSTHCVKDAQGKETPLTYYYWLKLAKAGGESFLESHLRKLNANKSYRDKLKTASKNDLVKYIDDITHGELVEENPSDKVKKIAPSGIIQRFGFALMSFRIVEWEPHSSTKPLADALLSKETQAHTAEGVRQKAFGERDAAKAQAEGDTSRFAMPIEALVKLKVDPNVAANVLATQLRTENIRDSKVTTYVEGGASASVMIQASQSTQNP